jgi:hypothetical protein
MPSPDRRTLRAPRDRKYSPACVFADLRLPAGCAALRASPVVADPPSPGGGTDPGGASFGDKLDMQQITIPWAQGTRKTRHLQGLLAMRMRGLEPPPGCPDTDLNRARLPIPPHPRAGCEDIADGGASRVCARGPHRGSKTWAPEVLGDGSGACFASLVPATCAAIVQGTRTPPSHGGNPGSNPGSGMGLSSAGVLTRCLSDCCRQGHRSSWRPCRRLSYSIGSLSLSRRRVRVSVDGASRRARASPRSGRRCERVSRCASLW